MKIEIVITALALVGFAGALFLGLFIRSIIDNRYFRRREEEAQKDAEIILEKAKADAEISKKEAALATKDEWLKAKQQFEKETEKKKDELRLQQEKTRAEITELKTKEDSVQRKEGEFAARDNFLTSKEKTLRLKEQEVDKVLTQQNERLEHIAHMTQDEARKQLLENLDNQVRLECAQLIKDRKDEARNSADAEARDIVLQSIQRCAADTTVENTVCVVHLPSDEMKGRIIGREGRNIRAFEEVTGIDVIVDDTPEAVILSSYDPVRREAARMTLEKLIQDGRIHPGRIEELFKKSQEELNKKMKEAAEEVLFELKVHGLKPKLVENLGRLKYRTSYGQNVLQHSMEVAILCGIIAVELGFDPKIAVRAGLLHDIGKAIDRENEGTHSELGAELAAKNGENSIICNAIAAHHEDVTAISPYPVIVQAADTISSTRPGVRKETLSNYVNRLHQLEEIADSFKGVSKTFVIQAGREIRVMVEPEQISDAQAEELGRQIAERIQNEMEYPGQIKVTTIRETRYAEYAK